MRRIAGWFGFLALVAVPPRAGAQAMPPLGLSVERRPGSERCPDQADLAARIEHIRGRGSEGTPSYQVVFERAEAELIATLRSGDDSTSARVLKTEDGSCDALAQAVAVTLALLLDSAPAVPAPPPPRPRPRAPALAPPPPAVPRRERSPLVATASVGATALGLVVRPLAPVLHFELGARGAAFRASLGAAWMVPQELELGPGRVRQTLWAGTSRICVAPLRSRTTRFDICGGAWLGQRSAQGEGYTENALHRSSWVGIPLEASVAQFSSTWGWELSAGALLSLPRRSYTIANVGSAYEVAPVGLVLSLRGVAAWRW